MKFLNSKKLGKSLIIFILCLVQPGFSEETKALDAEEQAFICAKDTSSIKAEEICLNDKIAIDRLAVCNLYTSNHVSEVLCLKNKVLSYKTVLQCYIDTNFLTEQICLMGSEASSRIFSQFKETGGDLTIIIKEIDNIKTEMETLLESKVKLVSDGEIRFVFDDDIDEDMKSNILESIIIPRRR